jgi:hypothetical protein
LKQIRKRLTYANVMSSIAVFLVLGGAAVAASQLPKNSVGAKQLKKGAVTAAKIKKGAVDSSKVADGSLQASDFKAGQLPAGPKGEKGEKGAAGPIGPIGPRDVFATEGASSTPIGAGPTTLATLNLPAGSYYVSGRASLQGPEQIVRCNFLPVGHDEDSVNTTIPGFQIEAVSFDALTLAAPGTVSFQCERFGASATAFDIVLTAIKVGSITEQ